MKIPYSSGIDENTKNLRRLTPPELQVILDDLDSYDECTAAEHYQINRIVMKMLLTKAACGSPHAIDYFGEKVIVDQRSFIGTTEKVRHATDISQIKEFVQRFARTRRMDTRKDYG